MYTVRLVEWLCPSHWTNLTMSFYYSSFPLDINMETPRSEEPPSFFTSRIITGSFSLSGPIVSPGESRNRGQQKHQGCFSSDPLIWTNRCGVSIHQIRGFYQQSGHRLLLKLKKYWPREASRGGRFYQNGCGKPMVSYQDTIAQKPRLK